MAHQTKSPTINIEFAEIAGSQLKVPRIAIGVRSLPRRIYMLGTLDLYPALITDCLPTSRIFMGARASVVSWSRLVLQMYDPNLRSQRCTIFTSSRAGSIRTTGRSI